MTSPTRTVHFVHTLLHAILPVPEPPSRVGLAGGVQAVSLGSYTRVPNASRIYHRYHATPSIMRAWSLGDISFFLLSTFVPG